MWKDWVLKRTARSRREFAQKEFFLGASVAGLKSKERGPMRINSLSSGILRKHKATTTTMFSFEFLLPERAMGQWTLMLTIWCTFQIAAHLWSCTNPTEPRNRCEGGMSKRTITWTILLVQRLTWTWGERWIFGAVQRVLYERNLLVFWWLIDYFIRCWCLLWMSVAHICRLRFCVCECSFSKLLMTVVPIFVERCQNFKNMIMRTLQILPLFGELLRST